LFTNDAESHPLEEWLCGDTGVGRDFFDRIVGGIAQKPLDETAGNSASLMADRDKQAVEVSVASHKHERFLLFNAPEC
jgi:hypothetical protein